MTQGRRKGFHHSKETKLKMSFSKKNMSNDTKKKMSKAKIGEKNAMYNKIFSEEHRKKLSESHKGKPTWNKGKKLSKEHISNLVKSHKGKKRKHSNETRRKMSEAKKGNKCYKWMGGITPINAKIRNSIEYKLWREAVFKRDNYTCVWCFDNKGGNLNADHIKPFSLFPELRFAIDNGRTLCVDCHRKTDTYGGLL